MSLFKFCTNNKSSLNNKLFNKYIIKLQDANNSTGSSRACISGGLWVRMIRFSQVVFSSVDHQGPSDDVMFSRKGNYMIYHLYFNGFAGVYRFNISQIPNVANFIKGSSMGYLKCTFNNNWLKFLFKFEFKLFYYYFVGVEMTTSRQASSGNISFIMNMETIPSRIQSNNNSLNQNWSISLLNEGHVAIYDRSN